jgi:hypothetical protein
MLVILAIQESEIRRIWFKASPGQRVLQTLSKKKKKSQKRASGVTQSVGLEFKHQYHKK